MQPDKFYLDMVALLAAKSKDTSRGVGTVIVAGDGVVLTTGFNEFANGTKEDPTRRVRPAKYLYTEHAERNAIYAAAKDGIALDGATLYQDSFPCADCARGIVQSGISLMVCREPDFSNATWGEHWRAADEILREGGVTVRYI